MEMLEALRAVKAGGHKFIIVTGGVCSSIGKGVLLSSLGVLLKNSGHSVSLMKMDPYLNVDPGTMSPLEHGEVFVLADGAETDLDLGHYERMLSIELSKNSSVSSGQIYKDIIDGEREGAFLGKCIQMIPHVTDLIKMRLLSYALDKKVNYILLELGGTVGDIEGEVFLEAIRQLKFDLGREHILHAHLSYVPFLAWSGELKTKPTQHSVATLKHAGLAPDFLFLRSDQSLDCGPIKKLALMCEVYQERIFQVLTYDPVYRLFADLDKQGVTTEIQRYFSQAINTADLSDWKSYVAKIERSTKPLKIGFVTKYYGSNDPYISVIEALKSATYHHIHKPEIIMIEAEALEAPESSEKFKNAMSRLKSASGVLVPGGFDKRGVKGKIRAANFAREQKIPYLGLCLGMQVMLIEFAQTVLKLKNANSQEFDSSTESPVISLMSAQIGVVKKGGSMRLGGYACSLPYKDSLAFQAYKKEQVMERHRHRYEFNNDYKRAYEEQGIVFSGMNLEHNLVEIAEIKDHPFMVGCQFHPEFLSRPLQPHPLFDLFVKSSISFSESTI